MCSLESCLFTMTPLRGSTSFVMIFLLLYQVSGFVCVGGGAVPAWAILCKLAQMRALWGPLTPHFPRHTIVHYSIPIAVLTGIEIMFLWPHHRQRALWKSTQKRFPRNWLAAGYLEGDTTDWLIGSESQQTPSKQRLRHLPPPFPPLKDTLPEVGNTCFPQDGNLPILYRQDHNGVVGMGQQRWRQSNSRE